MPGGLHARLFCHCHTFLICSRNRTRFNTTHGLTQPITIAALWAIYTDDSVAPSGECNYIVANWLYRVLQSSGPFHIGKFYFVKVTFESDSLLETVHCRKFLAKVDFRRRLSIKTF